MRFGVGTARRGWIEPRHVLNTRSVDDVRAFVARKRAAWLHAPASPRPCHRRRRSRSGRTRRRCCRASTSATPAAFRRPCSGRRSARGRPTRSTTTLAKPFVARRVERRRIPGAGAEPVLRGLGRRRRRAARLSSAAASRGSLAGGAVAGLLLAFSYTFWTQAIIAEVYALHLALVGACLLALHACAAAADDGRAWPSSSRVYALVVRQSPVDDPAPGAVRGVPAAGARRSRARCCSAHRSSALALRIAARRARCSTAPQLRVGAGHRSTPRRRGRDRVAAFWFDTTKADWRESMVLGIRAGQVGDRLRDVVVRRAPAVRRRRPGARGRRRRAAVVRCRGRGRVARRWRYGDHDAVRADLQRRRHARVLPARRISSRRCCAGAAVASLSRPAASAARRPCARPRCAHVVAALAVRGWRGWRHLAGRRSPRRSSRRTARRAPHAGHRRPRRACCVSQMNWQLENVAALLGASPAAAISRGRGSATCCRTFRFSSRTTARSGATSCSPREPRPTSSRAYGPAVPDRATTPSLPVAAAVSRGRRAIPARRALRADAADAAARRSARRGATVAARSASLTGGRRSDATPRASTRSRRASAGERAGGLSLRRPAVPRRASSSLGRAASRSGWTRGCRRIRSAAPASATSCAAATTS